MIGVVFTETLRRSWLQMVYWAVGLAAMMMLMFLFVPIFDAIDFVGLMEDMPEFMIKAFGIGDDLSIMNSPEGIIAFGFFGKMAIMFAVYPVVMGMRVTTNDEDEGIMDMVLSLPLPRWQMIAEKFAAYTVTILVIVAVVVGGMWLGAQLIAPQFESEINLSNLAPGTLMLFPLMVLVMGVTVFIGTLFRRRQTTLAVVTAFVIASYMLQTIGGMASGTLSDIMLKISFFSYFDLPGIMQQGFLWGNAIGMVLVGVALTGVGVVLFQRRDVGV